MATIGWIKVGVAAMTGPFDKSMRASGAQIEAFGQKLQNMAGAYLGFEALKAGAQSVKELVTSSIEGVSQTKILSERVGMSAQAFGKLSYAAKLAHVDQDSFAVSLEQMNKRLGEVAMEGSGPAADALKRFGLSASKLAGMGTEQAFFKLLGVMEGIRNPTERASVAMDIFGKSGQGMINLVAKGSEEIKALGGDAARMGIALSDIDVAKVEQADQAMIKLHEAGQGFYNMIVTELSPVIVELIDRYVEWGYSGTKSASFVSQGMDWVVSGVGKAVDASYVFVSVFHAIEAAIGKMVGTFLGAMETMVSAAAWVERKLGTKHGMFGMMEGFSGGLSKGFKDFGADEWAKAQEAWAKVGAGQQTVRKLVDDVKMGATERAAAAVGKAEQFNAAGALSKPNLGPFFARFSP
jgi:hypothetical protein